MKKRSVYFYLFLISLFVSPLSLPAQSGFSDFPWLNDIVNTANCCENKTITAYQSGIFTFIYIEKEPNCTEVNELYFEDGRFYCKEVNGMDCLGAYGLTLENATVLWNCDAEKSACDNPLGQEWLQDFLDDNCTGNIYSFEFDGEPIIYVSTLCSCIDAPNSVYDCNGNEICFFGFVNPDVACDPAMLDHLTPDNLIWSPECDCECPVDFTPVCGADGNTYESACAATCAGVDIVDYNKCPPPCTVLDSLLSQNLCEQCISEVALYSFEGQSYYVTFGDNTTCSDALTTVVNCASSETFCLEGGIAGFNQCERFFAGATKIETKWLKSADCEGIAVAPCTDVQGVDFGLCAALMGVAIVNGKCSYVSGCLNYTIDGVNYSNAFFPSMEICQQTCEQTDNAQKIFDEYPWLTDIVNPSDCQDEIVNVYDLGAYSFIYVKTGGTGTLYYENGLFYCMSFPNYDCLTLYGLTDEQITDTWTCGAGFTQTSTSPRDKNTNFANNSKPKIHIFPNPSDGIFQIQLPTTKEAPQLISVFDFYGKKIKEMKIDAHSSSITMDLSTHGDGIYLLEWQVGSSRNVVKLIKQGN